MNASDVNRGFDLLSLASADTRLRRAGSYHVGPCPFCGGRDRFSIKATPGGFRWYCRKCGDGRYHTSVDYVMRRQHLDFAEAVAALGGEAAAPRRCEAIPSRIIDAPLVPDSHWQAAAWREVDAASESLLSADQAEPGRQYLLGRGLQRGTWMAHQLGFARVYDPSVQKKRPAIVLPWFDLEAQAQTLTAVKYRFIR